MSGSIVNACRSGPELSPQYKGDEKGGNVFTVEANQHRLRQATFKRAARRARHGPFGKNSQLGRTWDASAP